MMEETEIMIREGFLCPMCMKDLGTVTLLQDHFDRVHNVTDADKDVVDHVKGLFDKAKRKILRRIADDDPDNAFKSTLPDSATDRQNSESVNYTAFWEPQEFGASRSLMESFKSVRDTHLNYFVAETNKLLIRLDKLISPALPTDPSKRQVLEKSIVPWAPDADVNICTTCGKSFGLLSRRRHHCRLCGCVMCHQCSNFLQFSYAKKLLDPSFHYEGRGFRRSSSNSSLNSMLSTEGDLQLRTCHHCSMLLERRCQQTEQRYGKTDLVVIYEKLRHYIGEAESRLSLFYTMAESLRAAEMTYSITDAHSLRAEIVKLYDRIDSLSKRIATYGMDSAEPPPARAQHLQRMVRVSASTFLQENMLTPQILPTEEELRKLQETKRREAQQRIEEERKRAEQEQRMLQPQARASSPRYQQASNAGIVDNAKQKLSGWKPMERRVERGGKEDSSDPMLEQINNIKSYVAQAKLAQRWDEVQMLEENLRELQTEYSRQQQS